METRADTWALLPNNANTPFFLSERRYYQVLWTNPAGNAYFILAHAYIAVMNGLNEASTAIVDGALYEATQIFATYTPAQIGALKSNNALRAHIIELAALLDAYNNGITGPGHCDQ